MLFVEDVTTAVTTPADVGLVAKDPCHDDGGAHTMGRDVFLAVVEDVEVGLFHHVLHELLDVLVVTDGILDQFGGEFFLYGLYGNG